MTDHHNHARQNSQVTATQPAPLDAATEHELASLRERLQSLSLLDCQASLLTYVAQYFWADGRVPGPQGSGHASVVPYQALATRDVEWK